METSFPNVRKLLGVIMDGKQAVGHSLWTDAKKELDAADPLMAAFRPERLPSVSEDAPTPNNAMSALADMFLVLEHVIEQTKAAGALTVINPMDCDRMLRAKSILQRYGYKTASEAQREPTFKLARRRDGYGGA